MTVGTTVGVKQLGHGQGNGRLLGSFWFFAGMTGLLGSGRLDLDDVNYRFFATAERFRKESRFNVYFHSINRRAQVVVPFPILAPLLTFFFDLVNLAVLPADETIKSFLEGCQRHAFKGCSQPLVSTSNEFNGSLHLPLGQGLFVSGENSRIG